MPLDRQKLEAAIGDLIRASQSATSPVSQDAVRRDWSAAYHSYAKVGEAVGGGKPTLVKTLVGSLLTGKAFLPELVGGIRAYWMGAVWTPTPTLGFVTAAAEGLEPLLSEAFLKNAASPASAETASKRIAKALHTYTTKMVTVTATNIQSGATAIVKIV